MTPSEAKEAIREALCFAERGDEYQCCVYCGGDGSTGKVHRKSCIVDTALTALDSLKVLSDEDAESIDRRLRWDVEEASSQIKPRIEALRQRFLASQGKGGK